MPLVTCPDCSKSHSDAAPACPGCGRPNARAPQQRATVTVEQTAKRWKMLKIGAVVAVLATLGASMLGAPSAVLVAGLVVAAVLGIAGSAGAYWHHG